MPLLTAVQVETSQHTTKTCVTAHATVLITTEGVEQVFISMPVKEMKVIKS